MRHLFSWKNAGLGLLGLLISTQIPLFCEWHFWEAFGSDGPSGGYTCSYKNLYESFFSPWAEPTLGVGLRNGALLLVLAALLFGFFHLLERFFRWLYVSKTGRRWAFRSLTFLTGVFLSTWVPFFCRREVFSTSENGVVTSVHMACTWHNLYSAYVYWALPDQQNYLLNGGLLVLYSVVVTALLFGLIRFLRRR